MAKTMRKRQRNKIWRRYGLIAAACTVAIGGLVVLCACTGQGQSAAPAGSPLAVTTAPSTGVPATLLPSPTPPMEPTVTPPVPPTVTPPEPRGTDLEIRGAEPLWLVPGTMTVYTLTVHNSGPALATGILVTDVLAPGVTPLWAQSAQPLCGRQERAVACDVGDLWPGDAITVTLDLSIGGTEALITGTQLAGVALDLLAPACTIGPDADQPRVTCHLDRLQPGADVHMRIGVMAEAWVTGTLVHTATVTANEIDADPIDDSVAFTMTVGASPPVTATAIPAGIDLVVQAEGPSTVVAGQPFTAAFTVTNQGAVDATGVRFESLVPLAADLLSYTPDLPRCEQSDNRLICGLRNPDSGKAVTFTLVITGHGGQPIIIEPDALMPGWPICTVLPEREHLHFLICELGRLGSGQATRVQWTLNAWGVQERTMAGTASVRSRETDLNSADNEITTTIAVQVRADLALSSMFSGPAIAGESLSYILTVANRGPSAADVVLTDELPAGTRLLSAVPSRGDDCRIGEGSTAGTIVCNLGRLLGSETITVAVVLAVDESLAPGQISHFARVTTEQPDPDLSNNELMGRIPVGSVIEDE